MRYDSGLQSEQCVSEWEEGGAGEEEQEEQEQEEEEQEEEEEQQEEEEEEEGRFRNKTRTLHCGLMSWCCLDLEVMLLLTAIILQLLLLPLKQQLQLSQARFKLHLTWHTSKRELEHELY